jgi:hypothetical protein
MADRHVLLLMGVVENDDGCNAGYIDVVVIVARRWERVDSVDEEKAAALGTTNMVMVGISISKDVMQTDAISAAMTPMLAIVILFRSLMGDDSIDDGIDEDKDIATQSLMLAIMQKYLQLLNTSLMPSSSSRPRPSWKDLCLWMRQVEGGRPGAR